MILDDRETKVRIVAEAIDMLIGMAIDVLHDKLAMKKVPLLFMVDNKRTQF